MDAIESVAQVHALIAEREIAASMRACALARASLEGARGNALLALQEAIADSLDAMLTELGEHGLQNQALWEEAVPGNVGNLDVAGMTRDCAAAWQEVKRLRAAGCESQALISPHVGGWMDPIGSRDWQNKLRLAVAHRDAKWIDRVTRSLRDDEAPE
ncbi:hypothetical protein [Corallococcus terminator]|uniref:Uncharacterized protein n=1 Tax=Corallococcus terminator TaxID=2316733 RepID=A0A3A8JD47_9BACT|nr:hypothetical protein [Corallococcus terminator]RKG92846.1 hypothetical protein D7V88_04585 [Corallococcus terminator]